MDAPEGNGQQKDEDSLHHKGVCTAKRLFLGNSFQTLGNIMEETTDILVVMQDVTMQEVRVRDY